MPFVQFTLGEQKVQPGEYYRIVNAGPPGTVSPEADIVAVLAQCDQGPLNVPTVVEDTATLQTIFGTAAGVQVAVNALNAGAPAVLFTRVGSGGAAAVMSLNLADGTTAAVTIPLASVGTAGNAWIGAVADSLYDSTKRVFSLYNGLTLVGTVTFAKAPTTSGGHGEAGALVAALNASPLFGTYLGTAALAGTPGDTTTLQAAQVTASGGSDPTVTNSSYTGALTTIQTQNWTYLVTDSVDQSVGAAIAAYIDHQRALGAFQYAILGEPTSVTRANREAHALAYNDIAITYVGNGYTDLGGTQDQAPNACGTVAGMRAGSDYNAKLTGAVIPRALPGLNTLLDPFVESTDRDTAINDGVFLFHVNGSGQVKILYDINTFVTPNAEFHQGWKYNYVVQIYDKLLRDVGATWDELSNLDNDSIGRGTVIQAANRILTQMVAERSLQNDGQAICYEDPQNPPSGDSAWFIFQGNVVYGLAKLYVTAQFTFAPVSTVTA